MVKFTCRDYGFDCDFVIEGEATDVIDKYGAHSEEEHGIEYSKEALMQFILRKGWSNAFFEKQCLNLKSN